MTSRTSLVRSSELFKILDAGDLLGDLKNLVLENPETADLDLPNILVIYSLPLPRDDAWEAARTEGLVLDKTNSKDLPSDNSYESKLKRTAYRAKVIEVLSEQSNWLTTVSIGTENVVLDSFKSEASAAVLKYLSAKLPHPFKEIEILFWPISRSVLDTEIIDQQYLLTFVIHVYDRALGRVLTTIPTRFFSIRINDSKEKKKLSVSVGYVKSTWSFIHHQWDSEEGKIAKPVIEAGEQILEKRQQHLALVFSF